MVQLVKLVQFSNVLLLIPVTLTGNNIVLIFVQFENALAPIDVMPLEMVTDVNSEKLLNVLSPMDFAVPATVSLFSADELDEKPMLDVNAQLAL